MVQAPGFKESLINDVGKFMVVTIFKFFDVKLVKCVVLENKDVSQFNGFGKSFNKSPCFMVCLEKNRKRVHGLFLFLSLLNALF